MHRLSGGENSNSVSRNPTLDMSANYLAQSSSPTSIDKVWIEWLTNEPIRLQNFMWDGNMAVDFRVCKNFEGV
jgi:hypothetical protein